MSNDGQHGSFREPIHPNDVRQPAPQSYQQPFQAGAGPWPMAPGQMPMAMPMISKAMKEPTAAWLLLLFAGGIGGHDFYLGSHGVGVFKLVAGFLSALLTALFIGYLGIAAIFVWNVIDAFRMNSRLQEVNASIWRENQEALRAFNTPRSLGY